MKNPILTVLVLLFSVLALSAQNELNKEPYPGYWQQHVNYEMEIDMDVDTYQYTGHQVLTYTNNSLMY